MRISKRLWFMPMLLLCIVPMVLSAQDNGCPALVNTALEAADAICESAGRNQVCYGNVSINATPRPDADNFSFETAGDIVDVASLQSLALSGMNVADNAWGVAIMKVQANLPDTMPGQNVTFVLFGDVEIENAAQDLPTVTLTANAFVNLMETPAADGAMLSGLDAGATIVADAQLADGSWLRVRLPEGGIGWLEATQVTSDGDLATLVVGEPGEPVFGPMQAFYFRSGISDSACAEAPESGIMIQTPEGAGRVTVNVNGIDLNLGSTAYIRTRPENQIGLSLIEGSGIAEVDGFVQYIPSGAWITVPTDEDGIADGPPNPPQPYNNDKMATLPVELLDREVEVPPSLTEDEIAAALEEYQTNGV
ncbi:MAG: hypothetical protein H7Y09_06720, partial [Chitinophagaceae bacterium]|nr:hypothetical protein [Anaerolineae bacterium]